MNSSTIDSGRWPTARCDLKIARWTAIFRAVSVVNYTAADVPYTRIIEHKHFALLDAPRTIVTYEYPEQYDETKIPYYPIRDDHNAALYERYRQLATDGGVIFGGRLGTYRYYDMHQVVAQAISMAKKELQRCGNSPLAEAALKHDA